VKIEELIVGDIVIVRPGESIPVDGVVSKARAA
jgi:cation transport ATPase